MRGARASLGKLAVAASHCQDLSRDLELGPAVLGQNRPLAFQNSVAFHAATPLPLCLCHTCQYPCTVATCDRIAEHGSVLPERISRRNLSVQDSSC